MQVRSDKHRKKNKTVLKSEQLKLKKALNKLKEADEDKNKAVAKVKRDLTKADKPHQKVIATKDEENEKLKKELVLKNELLEEAFGVIRSLSGMAWDADSYISWIHRYGFDAATRPKYRMFQLSPKLKAEVNTHGVLAGQIVEKFQRTKYKEPEPDDVRMSSAPIGGSAKKTKSQVLI